MIAHFLLFVAYICDLILGALVAVKLLKIQALYFVKRKLISGGRSDSLWMEWHREMGASHKCVQC
jgi:hypothetical protein